MFTWYDCCTEVHVTMKCMLVWFGGFSSLLFSCLFACFSLGCRCLWGFLPWQTWKERVWGKQFDLLFSKSDGAESKSVSTYFNSFDSFLDSHKEKEEGLKMPLSSGPVTVKYERYAGGKKMSGEEHLCSVEALRRKRENAWDG